MKQLFVGLFCVLSILLGGSHSRTASLGDCSGCIKSYMDSSAGSAGSCKIGCRRLECMASVDGSCEDSGGPCVQDTYCSLSVKFQYTSCCDNNAVKMGCTNEVGCFPIGSPQVDCTADRTTSTCDNTAVWSDFPACQTIPAGGCLEGPVDCGEDRLCCVLVVGPAGGSDGGVLCATLGDCSACN